MSEPVLPYTILESAREVGFDVDTICSAPRRLSSW